MRKSDIFLNFLPINFHDSKFEVYRKLYNQEKISSHDLFNFKLPISEKDDNDYQNYLISFNPKDNFEKFVCNNKQINN